MPRDLFSDVIRPSVHVRSKKSSAFPLAIVLHLAALLVVVIAPLVATDVLPTPRRVLEFMAVAPPSIPPPPPGPSADAPRRSTRSPVSTSAAPLEAPDRIGEEIASAEPGVEIGGVPGGLPGGVPGGIDVGSEPSPPPPPAAFKEPIRPGGVIKSPKKTKEVLPIYPAIARAARVQGTVILDAVIDETGKVTTVRVLRSNPPLDAAAIDAVRQWEFTPTLLNGQPIPIVMTVTITFTLN
jgi:protein TonB